MTDLTVLKDLGWCVPLGVALAAVWLRLWACHKGKEELVMRILDDARARERDA